MFLRKKKDVDYTTTVLIFIQRGGWLMFAKQTHDVTFSPTIDVCVSAFY